MPHQHIKAWAFMALYSVSLIFHSCWFSFSTVEPETDFWICCSSISGISYAASSSCCPFHFCWIHQHLRRWFICRKGVSASFLFLHKFWSADISSFLGWQGFSSTTTSPFDFHRIPTWDHSSAGWAHSFFSAQIDFFGWLEISKLGSLLCWVLWQEFSSSTSKWLPVWFSPDPCEIHLHKWALHSSPCFYIPANFWPRFDFVTGRHSWGRAPPHLQALQAPPSLLPLLITIHVISSFPFEPLLWGSIIWHWACCWVFSCMVEQCQLLPALGWVDGVAQCQWL